MELKDVAAKRGTQTLKSALIAAALIYGLAPLITAISSTTNWTEFLTSWPVWTWELFKGVATAALTAIIAWANRRYVDNADLVIRQG